MIYYLNFTVNEDFRCKQPLSQIFIINRPQICALQPYRAQTDTKRWSRRQPVKDVLFFDFNRGGALRTIVSSCYRWAGNVLQFLTPLLHGGEIGRRARVEPSRRDRGEIACCCVNSALPCVEGIIPPKMAWDLEHIGLFRIPLLDTLSTWRSGSFVSAT